MAAFLNRALADQIALVHYLVDMDVVDVSGDFPSRGAERVDGDLYNRSLAQDLQEISNPHWIEFDLQRDYESLCVVAGVSDASSADTALEMAVYGDGVSLRSIDVELGRSEAMSIPVSGVLRLRLEIRPNTVADFDGSGVWANAFVSTDPGCDPSNADNEPQPLPQTYLSDLDVIDVAGDFPSRGVAEVGGEVYSRSVSQDLQEISTPHWVEYDLSRDFRRLCGVVGVSDSSTAATALEMEVLIDGVSRFVANAALGDAVPLNISISGALRIRVESRPDTTDDFSGSAVWADIHATTSGSCT